VSTPEPAPPAYAPGSNFESCPAATGQSTCPHFPDGAHRCGQDRNHISEAGLDVIHHTHRCTCSAQWCSLSGSVDDLIKLSVESALRTVATYRSGSVSETRTNAGEEVQR
jgi:hypothetical protein